MLFNDKERTFIKNELICTSTRRDVKHLFSKEYSYYIDVLIHNYSYVTSIHYDSENVRNTDYQILLGKIDEK